MSTLNPTEQAILSGMLMRRPDLETCIEEITDAHNALVTSYDGGGTLFACGNGGSCADALHIVGELCKSFERKRPLSHDFVQKLLPLPFGEELAANLEAGLPAIALGFSLALKTAVENDCAMRDISYAQELNAMMRSGDVLIALSTSGNAMNCRLALTVARAKGGVSIAMTGPKGGAASEVADIVIKVPGDTTKVVQEAHATVWHTLCCMIEAHYFPEPRN